MREIIIKEFQKNLKHKEFLIITNKKIISYVFSRNDLILVFVTINKVYLFTNSPQIVSRADARIIVCRNIQESINTIRKLIEILKLETVNVDIFDCPFELVSSIGDLVEIVNFNSLFLNKLNLDNDIMQINATITKHILDELLDKLTIEDNYITAKSTFRKLAYSYDIDDYHFSISRSEGDITPSDSFNKDSIYYFDCGISYKGIYSDVTISKKFSSYLREEIILLETILKSIEVGATGMLDSSPQKVYREIKNLFSKDQVLSNGFGHAIGILIHEDYSLSDKNNSILQQNTFFTFEPLVYVNKDSKMNLFRLEKTFGKFVGIVDYFKGYSLIR